MDLVLNEWFAEYACGTREQQSLVLALIERMKARGDRFVVAQGSPFYEKLCRYNKGSIQPALRMVFSALHDASRVLLLYQHELEVVDAQTLEQIPHKDRYLVPIMAATANRLLVTTDVPLCEAVNRMIGYKARLLDEFYAEYGS